MGAGPYPTEIFGKLAEDLREVGREYGTTTGRPRRIGWMDVVALRYVCRINGLTHLNITKLDVLSDLEEIKIGLGYKTKEGVTLTSVPADLETLEGVEVGGAWRRARPAVRRGPVSRVCGCGHRGVRAQGGQREMDGLWLLWPPPRMAGCMLVDRGLPGS